MFWQLPKNHIPVKYNLEQWQLRSQTKGGITFYNPENEGELQGLLEQPTGLQAVVIVIQHQFCYCDGPECTVWFVRESSAPLQLQWLQSDLPTVSDAWAFYIAYHIGSELQVLKNSMYNSNCIISNLVFINLLVSLLHPNNIITFSLFQL